MKKSLVCGHILFGNRYGRTREVESAGIEWLRHQAAIANVKQLAGRKSDVAVYVRGDQSDERRVHGTGIKAVLLRVFCPAPLHVIEKILAIRQKMGPAMRLAAARTRDPGHRFRNAARSGNAVELANNVRRKNDHAVAIPRSSSSCTRVAEHFNRTGSNIQGFHFSFGEEPDMSAVGRPERIHGVLCTVELLRVGHGKSAKK